MRHDVRTNMKGNHVHVHVCVQDLRVGVNTAVTNVCIEDEHTCTRTWRLNDSRE